MSFAVITDGERCAWLFDPEVQAVLNSLTLHFTLSFSATQVSGGITTTYSADIDETMTVNRTVWLPSYLDTDPSFSAIAADEFAIIRQGCNPSCFPVSAVTDEIPGAGLWEIELDRNKTLTGGYVNGMVDDDTPPGDCNNTNDLVLRFFLEFDTFVSGPDVLSATLTAIASPVGTTCFNIFELNPLFTMTTDPFDITMATLAELVTPPDVTVTVTNPGGYDTWSATATATFTGT